MENLTRYDLVDGEYLSKEMSVSSSGEWVKFSDIKELLQTSHNKQSDVIAWFDSWRRRWAHKLYVHGELWREICEYMQS